LLATGLVWIRHRLAVREHELRQDQLTGLGNRRFLGEQEARLRSLQRDHCAALLLLDLNDFKEVNDRLGHRVGDDLLSAVATRLRNALRPQDTLVRLGGDEFVVLLTDLPYPAVAKSVAGHLLDSLRVPLTVGGIDLEVGASVGIAAYPRDGENLDTLLQHAEIAMYEAKRSGIATVTYESAQDEHDVRQLALLAQLRRALASEELVLDYQPKLDLRSGTIVGFEALVRWNHPEHGLLSPDRFVPMAERTALIKPLTEWVLCTAVKQCTAWRRAGHDITVAVNVSPRNLLDPNLLTGVLSALQAGDLPAEALELEITETAVMTDPEAACGMLLQLRALGVRVSVDDFGVGYTSLSLLRSLPVRTLKIDRAFVTSMLDDPSCEAVVRCVIQLAKDLELSIIAEGVETPEVSQRLAALGCDEIQGWAVSRPMRPALVEGWLTEWAHSDRSATLSAGTDRRRITFPGVGYSG
jgi:diguanylate cyclase (GGDEF)-like protein